MEEKSTPFDFTEIDQIDLADPRELEAIAKDFDNIFFQHYTLPPHASHHEETDSNKFESDLFEDAGTASTIDATETFSDDLDLGPQIVWVISIENEQDDDSPDSGQSNLIIDMDGIVFSGDFDMYWKDAYGVNSDEEADWKESKYSTDSLAIEQLYLDHPEISGNLFPSDEEIIDIIRHPPVVLADKAESLQDGLYLLHGGILATGDSPVSEVGFILSNSIRFETPIRSIGERLGESLTFSTTFSNLEPDTSYYYKTFATNQSGESQSSIKRFKTKASNQWQGNTIDLGAGWKSSEWFGSFLPYSNDWIYHEGLGWAYVVPDGEQGIWIWTHYFNWQWTQSGTWPFLFRNEIGNWMYFVKRINGEPIFFNYEAGRYQLSPTPSP